MLIQFPAGAGGHFLAYFLSPKYSADASARIDNPEYFVKDKDGGITPWTPSGSDHQLTHNMDPNLGGLRIVPRTNIYGYLKTRWIKKEGGDIGKPSTPFNIDVFIHTQFDYVMSLETKDSFDYGNIWDIDKLSLLYNGSVPFCKIKYAKDYAQKNYWIEQVINPNDIIDLCIKIHQYEYTNNLINVDRIWSIDDMPTELEDAIKFFEDNKYRYDL